MNEMDNKGVPSTSAYNGAPIMLIALRGVLRFVESVDKV